MTFILNDGFYYEDYTKTTRSRVKKEKMPASQATFKEYEFNIDISDLVGDGSLDEERFKNNFKMLRINQLTDTIPILKTNYNDILMSRSKSISSISQSKLLYKYTDSLKHKNIDTISTLENFHLKEQISISQLSNPY